MHCTATYLAIPIRYTFRKFLLSRPVLWISVAFKMPKKNIFFFLSFVAYYFLKVRLHQSSKLKVIKKEVAKRYKSMFFFTFFAYYFFKVRLHQSSKLKSHKKEAAKQQKSRFFFTFFCLMMIQIRIRTTYDGFGSGRSKNIRILWIRIHNTGLGDPC